MLDEARHAQNFTSTMVEDYIVDFLGIEDELTKQKRFGRKNEEI